MVRSNSKSRTKICQTGYSNAPNLLQVRECHFNVSSSSMNVRSWPLAIISFPLQSFTFVPDSLSAARPRCWSILKAQPGNWDKVFRWIKKEQQLPTCMSIFHVYICISCMTLRESHRLCQQDLKMSRRALDSFLDKSWSNWSHLHLGIDHQQIGRQVDSLHSLQPQRSQLGQVPKMPSAPGCTRRFCWQHTFTLDYIQKSTTV